MSTTQVPPRPDATSTKRRSRRSDTTEKAQATQAVPPVKQRRRPMVIAVGIALVVLGGLGAAWVVSALSDTKPVVVLAGDVDRGQVIEEGDLSTVQISAEPGLSVVPADELEDYVGLRAARDLTSGTLLTDSAVTTESVPGEGESLVGVSLTTSQLPSSGLRPGDPVRLINTPGEGDTFQRGQPVVAIDARVVEVREYADLGQVVVDVTVPSDQASDVAALVATRRIALVVDSAATGESGESGESGDGDDAGGSEGSGEAPEDSGAATQSPGAAGQGAGQEQDPSGSTGQEGQG